MSLGKANDNIPYDEFAVAKLVQNAKGNGLKWCKGALYKDAKNNVEHALTDFSVSCCAAGAKLLEDDTRQIYIETAGNDEDYYPDLFFYRDSTPYMIGAGFRCAMGADDEQV